MPSSITIDIQDTGALTALEVERVREICGLKTYTEAESLTGVLNQVQRQATRADIATFDAIRDGTVALDGGRDGVNYSQQRDKEEVRQRLRLRLGLDAINPQLSSDAAYLVNIQTAAFLVPSESEF